MPLVGRLLAFGVALLLPVLAFNGVLLWQFASSERDRLENEVRDTARYAADALDRKLEGLVLTLRALSLSSHLQAGDLEAFRTQAEELGHLKTFTVVLRDGFGRLLLDTRLPRGTPPVPGSLTETDLRALQIGEPVVSGLLLESSGRSAEFTIVSPVAAGAAARPMLLSLNVPVELALEALRPQELPSGWTSSFVDGAGRIVARSNRNEEFVGHLATNDLRRSATGEAGTWVGTTATGEPVVAAYQRSQLSGWRAAVGVPTAVLREPLRHSLWIFAGLAATALLASALLAHSMGRSIPIAIGRLAYAARRLAHGDLVQAQPSGIREVDTVAEAIAAASLALREGAAERDRVEEALREETHALETLNRIGTVLSAELNLDRLLQAVTDAATELSGARFGAFFYNAPDPRGGYLTHYIISGVPRNAFAHFPIPRATELFGPTLRGEGIVRIADVTLDARYGRNAPFRGMPEGYLPVRSYMAIPVIARSGEVIGGLFFGHPKPAVFLERHERLVAGVAAQAAIAIDNARLFEEARRAREGLEQRVAERTRELKDANARLRREVSAREAMQAQLAQAQKMEALGQLAGGIAHDFNNVLQAIAGALRLIARRPEDPGRVRHLAGMASEATERGASITRRLLAFARRGELRAEPVNVAATLGNLREVLAHTLGAGVEVRAVVAGELPPVMADRGQLEAVLVNLATNARDAMPDGGTLTLSAALEEVSDGQAHGAGLTPGAYLRLVVEDTGSGMDAKTLEHATEPFFTTKPLGRGTGLGLSMAKGFAEQSGGGIGIESESGRGTRVSLWFPCFPAEADQGSGSERAAGVPIPITASGAPETPAAPGGSDRRVLVVDDEPMVRATLAAELSARGWHVIEAAGPVAALMRLEASDRLDLLVTDLAMPGMNGLALLHEARQRRPGLPAVLLTGYLEDDTAPALCKAAAGGPFALLRKPVSSDDLAVQAERLIERCA
ncbi:ATP-binding protein [Siccirubricoccus deserti]|uniref:histidine kinase n=1 Tax=Siccirubricoccus deserti TaxID=2013562 RepID=A0A9X0R5I3_9PROT|nr:ATP-binding protein [Siccirubricoccus deserti]MBC4018933.1 GAF domain-containing protein [Siccirubricoccus deserti]